MSKNNPPLPYAKKAIGLLQLIAQERAVDEEKARVYLNMQIGSSPEEWALYEELGTVLEVIRQSRRDLAETPVEGITLVDRVKIWLYKWAVRDRLEEGEPTRAST